MPTLQDVPQQIKNAFGSVETTQKIRRISHRAGLETPNSIPRLLYLLEIKEFSVHDFLGALRERLGVSERKAKAIAKALKENILEFERASLYQWGVDITEIDTHDAPELEEFVQDAITDEEEEIEAGLGSPKKEGVSVIPIIVEKTPAKEREEEKKQTIKINPALLRMQQDRSQSTNASKSTNVVVERKEGGGDKPFVLFEQKGAEAPKKQGRGFSMPFGFFKRGGPGGARIATPHDTIQARVESLGMSDRSETTNYPNLQKEDAKPTSGAQKPRVVHYSGERTQVTPFAKEEELFAVKDRKEIFNFQFPISNDLPASRQEQQNTMSTQRVSLQVEAPAKSGEVQIKKNPFSFPGSQQNAKSDGKPRVEGNVINLK